MTDPSTPPPPNVLLQRLSGLREQLRKSERAVADAVLADPQRILRSSIAQLAQQTGTSQPTVARFARALGYEGYRDFKLQLAQSLAAGRALLMPEIEPEAGTASLIASVVARSASALLQLREQTDAATVDAIVGQCLRASQIVLGGIGHSGLIAEDAELKLFRYGLPVRAQRDAAALAMAASLLKPGDVFVAISASGRSRPLLAAVALAREAGATIVALTASGSPLAQQSDHCLAVDMPEDVDLQMPMLSRLAMLVLCDVLAVALALRLGAPLHERLRRSKAALGRLRDDDMPRSRRRRAS